MTDPTTLTVSLSEDFGRAMRVRRAELGITQADLAERSGTDRSYIGQVERGERNLTLNMAGRIAEGLDTKASVLLASAEDDMAK